LGGLMLTPRFRFTFTLVKFPASLGTLTYRWSERPFADTGKWSEGRLTVIGDIERSCTDQDGNYRASELTIEGADDDGVIRALLADATTQTFTSREGWLELLSESGYLASAAWRSIFRGRVTDIQATPGRRWTMKLTDVLGSEFSGFNLEKLIPIQRLNKADHPTVPDKNDGLPYPLIVGEHTDVGRVDENGDPADKGVLPVIYLGNAAVDGSEDPPQYLPAPSGLTLAVTGTPGTTTYTYGVSTISQWGESTLAVATITTAPDTLDGSNYVTPSWDAVSDASAYRVWRIAGTSSPTSWIVVLDNGGTFADPETTFDDIGLTGTPGNPPLANTALFSGNWWGQLECGLGVIDVHEVYGSNLAEGTAPKRIRLTSETENVTWMRPTSSGWPYPNPYLDTVSGIRHTIILARGPLLKQHIDGTVTIAFNGCGMKNASGVMVDQAFRAGLLFINEHILKKKGAGSRGETPTSLETFANGDAQMKSTAWEAAQTLTETRIGGNGYMAAWAIHDPITVREFLRWFCITFDCRIAVNHHGQIYPVLVDDMADSTVGRLYRDREEDVELIENDLAHDEVENRIVYDTMWNADSKSYDVQGLIVEDADSIAAHSPGAVSGDADQRGVRQKSTYGLRCTRDMATAADAMARRLTRNKQAPYYVTHRQNLMGLEDELGDQVRIRHYDAIYPDVKFPALVLKHKTLADEDQFATELTCLDIRRISILAAPALANDTSTILLADDSTAVQLR
jgi:hypothetical protein